MRESEKRGYTSGVRDKKKGKGKGFWVWVNTEKASSFFVCLSLLSKSVYNVYNKL